MGNKIKSPFSLYLLILSWAFCICVGCAPRFHTMWGPHRSELRFYEYEGSRICYRIFVSDKKKSILFLHGLGSSKATWQYVTPSFKDDNQIIIMDLRGHGDSDKPDDNNYSIEYQSKMVSQFIIDSKLRNLIIVGHSYGGCVALETAYQLFKHHREPSYVAGLIIIGAPAFNFIPHSWLVRNLPKRLMRTLYKLARPKWIAEHFILKSSFWRDERIDHEMIDEYTRCLSLPGAKAALQKTIIKLYDEYPNEANLMGMYKLVDCPVFLLWGANDTVVPQWVMCKLEQTLTNVRTAIISDCGHAPQAECPIKTIAEIQPFIKELRMEK